MKRLVKSFILLSGIFWIFAAAPRIHATAVWYRGYTINPGGALGFSNKDLKPIHLKYVVSGDINLHIKEVKKQYIKVYLPDKKEWVYMKRSDVLMKASGFGTAYSTERISVHRRNNNKPNMEFGVIAPNKKVSVLGRKGGYVQVLYQAEGKSYFKVGWITERNANSFLLPPPSGIKLKRKLPVTLKGTGLIRVDEFIQIVPSNAHKGITTKSSNSKVIRGVKGTGYLKVLKPGDATVTFTTINGISKKIKFKVKK